MNYILRNVSSEIDHDKAIPSAERTGSASYSVALLCKQDKEQMDRIEEKLDRLLTINDKQS